MGLYVEMCNMQASLLSIHVDPTCFLYQGHKLNKNISLKVNICNLLRVCACCILDVGGQVVTCIPGARHVIGQSGWVGGGGTLERPLPWADPLTKPWHN